MEEAERLSDDVAIVDHGRLVAEGTPAELTGSDGQLRFRAQPGLSTDSLLSALPGGTAAKESPEGHYVIEVQGRVDPATARRGHRLVRRARRAGQGPAGGEPDPGGRLPGADRPGTALMTSPPRTDAGPAPACRAVAVPARAGRGPAAADGRGAGVTLRPGRCCATASSCCWSWSSRCCCWSAFSLEKFISIAANTRLRTGWTSWCRGSSRWPSCPRRSPARPSRPGSSAATAC